MVPKFDVYIKPFISRLKPTYLRLTLVTHSFSDMATLSAGMGLKRQTALTTKSMDICKRQQITDDSDTDDTTDKLLDMCLCINGWCDILPGTAFNAQVCSSLDEAIHIFKRDGFCILPPQFGEDWCVAFKSYLIHVAHEFYTHSNKRGDDGMRFSMQGTVMWNCTHSLDFIACPMIRGLIEAIMPDRWKRWHLTKLGGEAISHREPIAREPVGNIL